MSEPGEPDPTEPTRRIKAIRQRIPVSSRAVAVLGVALGCVGVGVYFAVSSPSPGQTAAAGNLSGKAGHSSASPNGSAVPGPMPGAPGPGRSMTPARAADAPKPLKPAASVSSKVKAWGQGSGGAAMTQVTTQSGSALMAHGAGQYPEMLQACRALTKAVQRAEGAPPIPDSAMQKEYSRSLSAFRAGAANCTAAISQHASGVEDTVTDVNKTVLATALKQFGQGQTELYIATEVLRKQ